MTPYSPKAKIALDNFMLRFRHLVECHAEALAESEQRWVVIADLDRAIDEVVHEFLARAATGQVPSRRKKETDQSIVRNPDPEQVDTSELDGAIGSFPEGDLPDA